MQYKVPQNIDQEDKILGPLTFLQFVYVLIGGGILLLEFTFFDLPLFFLIGIPTLILTICFSLIKVQDQPFSRFFVALLVYLRQPKRRIWVDQQPAEQARATTGLGEDFFADAKHDLPTSTPLAPTAVDTVTPATPQKILAIQSNTASTAFPMNLKTAATDAANPMSATNQITAKPARKLQINVLKGAT